MKIIVEACYLDEKLKRLACKIVEDIGADFIKTSTGKGTGGATVRDVELLPRSALESVGVKPPEG